MRVFLASIPFAVALAAPSAAHIYTGRVNDVFRVPGAALRCEVGQEGGAINTSCGHVPYAQARYQVVFYKNNLLVFRLGNPDRPVWSSRGRP
jgi:hypothetical protein